MKEKKSKKSKKTDFNFKVDLSTLLIISTGLAFMQIFQQPTTTNGKNKTTKKAKKADQ